MMTDRIYRWILVKIMQSFLMWLYMENYTIFVFSLKEEDFFLINTLWYMEAFMINWSDCAGRNKFRLKILVLSFSCVIWQVLQPEIRLILWRGLFERLKEIVCENATWMWNSHELFAVDTHFAFYWKLWSHRPVHGHRVCRL